MVLPPSDASPGSDPVDARERERIRKVYDAYAESAKHRRIWGDTRASRFLSESKWSRIAALLREARFDPVAGTCLDIGTGDGCDMRQFARLGVPPDRIVGMDLLVRRLVQARRLDPRLAVIQGDARQLPFPAESLSLVYQSTMLSSVLDAALRRAVFGEIRRVLRPGGFFLSFDSRYPNPWNANTRPVAAAEVRRSFDGWTLWIRSANGIPQLIRLLAPVSLALCRRVESVPVLRSHLLVLAQKPAP